MVIIEQPFTYLILAATFVIFCEKGTYFSVDNTFMGG